MFGHHHHHHQDLQEDVQLDAMQRVWQGNNSRQNNNTLSAFFEQAIETENDLINLARQNQNAWSNICAPPPQEKSCNEENNEHFENDYLLDIPESASVLESLKSSSNNKSTKSCLELDASDLNDLPAHYTICSLLPHQFPVCGVYIDKRIICGFKYKVRPLPSVGKPSTINKCLFDGQALRLQSIGRGFARRLTFEADNGKLNSNNNYLYSDNRPEGYAFELEVISKGDKFTIFDLHHEPQGIVEILKIEGPQFETFSVFNKLGIEKHANVKFTGKVEFYDTGVAKPILLNGIVVALKPKQGGKTNRAEVTRVINIYIKKRKYYLIPGIRNNYRRVTVRGEDIGDVPTKYTMTGLEPYELPVVGTYVDARVLPGFYYKVRANNKNYKLFNGRALRLISIGIGYAKRLTFESDSLNHPDNYLWSDNHPDGLGLEPRAVSNGMKFSVKVGDQEIGEASIFRDDKPQFEEKSEKVKTETGQFAIVKHIHIDVICHIQLTRPGGGSSEQDSYLMRISGVAVVRKEPKAQMAKVVEINNIGLDSPLYILFTQQMHAEIKFIPKTLP